MIIELNDDNFREEVLESEKPVLVDFWAPWCGYCRRIEPTIHEIAEQYDGKLKVCKINIDDSQKTAITYGVMTIPYCAKFVGGEIAASAIGAYEKDELIAELGL